MSMSSQTITIKRSGKVAAKRQILQDLINAFLTEELLTEPHTQITRWEEMSDEQRSEYEEKNPATSADANAEGWLYQIGNMSLRVVPSIRLGRQWLAGSSIYHQTANGIERIDEPAQIAQYILQHVLEAEAYAQSGVAEFITGIDTATRQLALALETESLQRLQQLNPDSAYEWFIAGEQIAALRDRPFHPSSKAKTGFSEQDCLHYAAEFGQAIKLRWLALRNEVVQAGISDPVHSCLELLVPEDRHLLETECRERGLDSDAYTLIPVHPWQLEHIILPRYTAELDNGDVVVLRAKAGDMLATSSLRSMAPQQPSKAMLKLPVSVLSLGAARYLPVVKLLNGLSGERMLRQAVACDEQLKERVYLCQENHWWGYMPTDMGLFDDHPRHLAVQLRLYPQELLDDSIRILPMAALGVELEGTHLFNRLLGKTPTENEVLQLYTDIAELFYDVVMRLFKVGVVPEIHGQNCCIVWKKDRPAALLFRDHDSVRLHPPYTEQHGIEDPRYHIRPGYSNSLYNETLEKLIFYVQSLGTQVNLASIMESIANVYGIDEQHLWQITESAWKQALATVELPEADRKLLYRIIFEAEQWPTKLIVRPLLEADGVPGAMPSGKGYGHNPFRR